MQLKKFLSKSGITQTAFAKRCGISKSAMSRYTNAQRVPLADVADRIIRASDGKVALRDLIVR